MLWVHSIEFLTLDDVIEYNFVSYNIANSTSLAFHAVWEWSSVSVPQESILVQSHSALKLKELCWEGKHCDLNDTISTIRQIDLIRFV